MLTPPTGFPNTFLGGAPRAGTTNLAFTLSSHADVFLSEPKEPFFFASSFPRLRAAQGIERSDEYHRLFVRARNRHAVRMDGSTLYLACSTAAPEILDINPDARFLICTRRHSDLVVSLHRHLTMMGLERRTIADAWNCSQAQIDREADRTGVDALLINYRSVLAVGRQIKRLEAQLGNGQLMTVGFDELTTERESTLARIQQFLGIELRQLDRNVWTNRTLQPRSVALSRAMRSPRARLVTSLVKQHLSVATMHRVRAARDRVLTRGSSAVGPVDAGLLAEIDRYFASDASLVAGYVYSGNKSAPQ